LTVKIQKIAREYFKAWNRQDLIALGSLLTEDVRLRDWDISVHGKKDVIQANRKIYDAVPKIRADVVEITSGDRVIFAQLKVFTAVDEFIEVVDILRFSKDIKISSIHAYKCRTLLN
jgi:hypothetical protein